MSAAQHTPGPWEITEEVGASRPFFVSRRRNGKSPYSVRECMKGADGREASFASLDEAHAALSKAQEGGAA